MHVVSLALAGLKHRLLLPRSLLSFRCHLEEQSASHLTTLLPPSLQLASMSLYRLEIKTQMPPVTPLLVLLLPLQLELAPSMTLAPRPLITEKSSKFLLPDET